MNTDDKLLQEKYLLVLEDIENKIPYLTRQFPNVTADEIRDMINYDPTGRKGKFVPWMAKLRSIGNIKFPEDGEKINEALKEFIAQVQSPQFIGEKDINTYKTYGDLAKILDKNKGKTSVGAAVRQATERGMEIVHEDSTYKIYKITTQEAAAKACRHTKWCVKDPEYSQHYLKNGPLYMITKQDKPYVLFHFESGSIKDVYDSAINKKTANELRHLLENFPQFQNLNINDVIITPELVQSVAEYASDPEMILEMRFGNNEDILEEVFQWTAESSKRVTIFDLAKNFVEGYVNMVFEAPSQWDNETFPGVESLPAVGDFLVFSDSGIGPEHIINKAAEMFIETVGK
jgi:hypothetical protein